MVNFYGKNLKSVGSGNIGATNATRILGFSKGLIVFSLDFLKCFLVVFSIKIFDNEIFAVITGCVIVIGHIFPIYLRFVGGKGVASLIGLYFGLNFYLGIIFIVIWFVIFKIWKQPFLASIISSTIVLSVLFYLSYSQIISLSLLFLTFIVVAKHHSNKRRFVKNQEHKF